MQYNGKNVHIRRNHAHIFTLYEYIFTLYEKRHTFGYQKKKPSIKDYGEKAIQILAN